MAYEKGHDLIGDHPSPNPSGQIPDWGKQWIAPWVLVLLKIDRHPVLGEAIEDHFALLSRTDPRWWGGDWRERRRRHGTSIR